jgi:hypothetical protein
MGHHDFHVEYAVDSRRWIARAASVVVPPGAMWMQPMLRRSVKDGSHGSEEGRVASRVPRTDSATRAGTKASPGLRMSDLRTQHPGAVFALHHHRVTARVEHGDCQWSQLELTRLAQRRVHDV